MQFRGARVLGRCDISRSIYSISSSPRGARNIEKCDISRSICGISNTPNAIHESCIIASLSLCCCLEYTCTGAGLALEGSTTMGAAPDLPNCLGRVVPRAAATARGCGRKVIERTITSQQYLGGGGVGGGLGHGGLDDLSGHGGGGPWL